MRPTKKKRKPSLRRERRLYKSIGRTLARAAEPQGEQNVRMFARAWEEMK